MQVIFLTAEHCKCEHCKCLLDGFYKINWRLCFEGFLEMDKGSKSRTLNIMRTSQIRKAQGLSVHDVWEPLHKELRFGLGLDN